MIYFAAFASLGEAKGIIEPHLIKQLINYFEYKKEVFGIFNQTIPGLVIAIIKIISTSSTWISHLNVVS
jgi:hypothetical protein